MAPDPGVKDRQLDAFDVERLQLPLRAASSAPVDAALRISCRRTFSSACSRSSSNVKTRRDALAASSHPARLPQRAWPRLVLDHRDLSRRRAARRRIRGPGPPSPGLASATRRLVSSSNALTRPYVAPGDRPVLLPQRAVAHDDRRHRSAPGRQVALDDHGLDLRRQDRPASPPSPPRGGSSRAGLRRSFPAAPRSRP